MPSAAPWQWTLTAAPAGTPGRQHQDEQGRVEIEVPRNDPQADAHRDDGDADRCQQLQHERGDERDPERGDRLLAVCGLAPAKPLRLGAGASEHLKGGQADDQVGEVPRQPGLQPPAFAGPRLGGPAHEHHEHRDQRQRQHHDQRRRPVHPEDRPDDDDRHGGRQHELGQVLGVEAVEGVQPLGHQRDEGRRGRRRVDGTVEPGAHDVHAQLRLHGRGRPLRKERVQPDQRRLAEEHPGQTEAAPGARRCSCDGTRALRTPRSATPGRRVRTAIRMPTTTPWRGTTGSAAARLTRRGSIGPFLLRAGPWPPWELRDRISVFIADTFSRWVPKTKRGGTGRYRPSFCCAISRQPRPPEPRPECWQHRCACGSPSTTRWCTEERSGRRCLRQPS